MTRETAASTPFELSPRLTTLVSLALILALAAIWGSRPLIHDDLFFHLSTGELVVDQGRVPTTDPFSYTRFGERWISHEWGFGLLAFGVYSLAGFPGVVALKALLAVCILLLSFLLMLRMTGEDRCRFGLYLTPLLALGLWAIDDQLVLRPSLVSCLLLVLLLHLLLSFDKSGGWALSGGIVGLFFVWGNLHCEVLFGLFVLGLVTLESLLRRIPRLAGSAWSSLLRASPEHPYLRLFALSCLASLINPNGIEVLLYPFRLLAFFARGEVELEMGHFTGAAPREQAAFYLLLALFLSALLPLRDRLRRLSLSQLVSVAAFSVLSFSSHRFIFYFTLLALPTLVVLWRPVMQRLETSKRPRLLHYGLPLVVCLVVGTTLLSAWRSHETALISRHFPRGTVGFLELEGVEGRLFNHQNYGGYLHWMLKRPVFWDGRNLLFEPLMRQLATMSLAEATAEWQFDYLVVTEHEFKDLAAQLTAERWGLVLWDDFAALYLRRESRFESLLAHRELKLLPPFGGVNGLNLIAANADKTALARRELDQILDFEPRSQRALYLDGLLSYYARDLQQAENRLEAAAAIEPNAFVYRALADVLAETGRDQEAERLRRQAIDIDSSPLSTVE